MMLFPFIKRFFDILFSVLALSVLLPLLLPIIILLRLTGEGEIFYKQKRVGYKNRIFYIWKFATMLKNSPNMKGGELTLRNDPRVTKMGKFLRITKINELPQLINVLSGDMSFVGPRPLMPISFEQYSLPVQAVVYNSRPGITGIGSVIFRDEERMVTDAGMDPREYYKTHIFPLKGQLEIWYQSNKSFYTDTMLLFLTAWVIFFRHSTLPYKVFKDLPGKS